MTIKKLTLPRKPFVFMRHAQTDANSKHMVCGSLDMLLDTTGVNQAIDCGELLAKYQWSCIATSALRRTQMTAELALPNQSFTIFKGLNERDWGRLEGTPIPEQRDYFATPAKGEAWIDFMERVAASLSEILNHYDFPLIIAHSGVWRVIKYLQGGMPEGPRIKNAQPMLLQPNPNNKEQWLAEKFLTQAKDNIRIDLTKVSYDNAMYYH
ncbi:histidine phosphatase family protein [Entomomonas asaccharolytica]|uniref:phosphoglycerate mutase (2,3-diphosphoglycerate-dependent) n=1 Tax=Entomomonas asaccharolytica TaxID=2785331 RepID=A0A974NDG2_9GAMM|nr:histidine phosphatase family protein [Entomomonas asaccharolytica]QQP84613.1 histidine phosphatase family protein [Entomomonas asaccharolytica]